LEKTIERILETTFFKKVQQQTWNFLGQKIFWTTKLKNSIAWELAVAGAPAAAVSLERGGRRADAPAAAVSWGSSPLRRSL
jgi:hypothetical protein